MLIQGREADVAEFLAMPRRARFHLLVRASQPSKVTVLDTDAGGLCKLMEAAALAPVTAEMSVEIPRKPGHPQRQAALVVRARRVNIHPLTNRRGRRRWLIEQLHKVLKSGRRAERLQIDDAHPLKNVLAVYYLVAWRLLWLTFLARPKW